MMTFSHKVMAFFFLVAGLSADMGVYRNSTMIRGGVYFILSKSERGRYAMSWLSIFV